MARAVQAEQTIGDWKQTAVAHAAASSSDSSDTSVASFSSSAASSSSTETRVILHKRSASRAECLAACAAVGCVCTKPMPVQRAGLGDERRLAVIFLDKRA